MISKALFVAAIMIPLAANAQANVRTYSNPNVDGDAVAACLADGTTCGKPAADAFCQMEGYRESILFQRKTVAEALILDTGDLCATGTCDAFASIKCFQSVQK